jgi:hypothetical protein
MIIMSLKILLFCLSFLVVLLFVDYSLPRELWVSCHSLTLLITHSWYPMLLLDYLSLLGILDTQNMPQLILGIISIFLYTTD